MKDHVEVKNHVEAKRVSRKHHAEANTDHIIRKAIARDALITAKEAIARDALITAKEAIARDALITAKEVIARDALITAKEVIVRNALITAKEAILAEDAARNGIIHEAEDMLIANGIKGICGSIAATAKHGNIIFETLFKRTYDKKGFFLCCREVK
ncbi:hypothetical protein QUF51_04745 [Bacillus pumilus]|nr:hypothetical protein [Bacillus pumilus]